KIRSAPAVTTRTTTSDITGRSADCTVGSTCLKIVVPSPRRRISPMRTVIVCVALLAMVVLSLATPSMSRAQATAILTSNFATLPGQPQSPGSIRVLTNKDRGVWLSTGANWYSAGGNFCNVKAFDALGDGLTDDTASIQRALDATQCGVVL